LRWPEKFETRPDWGAKPFIDLQAFEKAKTALNCPSVGTFVGMLFHNRAWYTRRFGECRPEWFVFAFGKPLPKDPTRPITSFKTAVE
jgi:hypothetical protein